MAEPPRPRICCTCMCFRRSQKKTKPEEDEDTSSIVFYRKFSDVWEEDSAEEEIVTCSQPLDDHVERPRCAMGLHSDYRKYIETSRIHQPISMALDSASDVTSWVETPESGEHTGLIDRTRLGQKMRENRRLLTLPLKEDKFNGNNPNSLESERDEMSHMHSADLSFSIDDSISNFMQSRVTMWTASSGLLSEDTNMLQEEVWSIHSDSAILLRDYLYPNEDWQASLDSYSSELDLSPDDEDEDEEGEDENGNADERTKILKKSGTKSKNGNRPYYKRSPMSLPGDTYQPVNTNFDSMPKVHRNVNDTLSSIKRERKWKQGIKRKDSPSTPEDVIEEAPLDTKAAA